MYPILRMTTIEPAPSSTPSDVTVSSHKPNAAYRLFSTAIILIVAYIVFRRILPYIPTALVPARERMRIDNAILSPVTAFVRLNNQNKTNIPPTKLVLEPPDYVVSLPEQIGDLTAITYISIRNQPMKKLPTNLTSLNNLTTLIVIDTPISRVPDSIGDLTNLVDLEFIGTDILALPDSIGNLPNLKALSLSYNHLHTLPATVQNLTHLIEMDLTGNNFPHIPRPLPPRVKFMFLGGNPIPFTERKAFNDSKVITAVFY